MRAWLTVSLAVLLVALVLLPVAPSRADDPGPDDPRVATVVQSAGAALVRPLGRRRWTPLERDDALFPRDTLRAASRGANALDVALVGGGRLVLGPGALVDLPERGRVTLRLGEIEIQAPEGGSVALETPGGRSQDVEGTTWWRGEATDATRLDSAPRWLAGWRASTGDEWVGTLVAQVDGRDVPLSVGHYRTTVEIRDGIARTTIQEGFVNATDQRLEGVFYFPLPADASISGFGMWVGDRLVEADIVERSRARQIYEDILRRKKDPGLLEWQGGNLFKARVYPIESNAEKRIRIRYTQVLRLEGRTYRYRQALWSDLLQRHPLRRLDVEVNVASEREIESVACVNHSCQVTQSEHAARLRFGADDVRPRDDLEVRIALAGDAPLAAVTHRRGEDGFFLLRIRPPEPEAQGWQRPLLPEGDGLDVVVLADTSGSMGPAAREAQSHFVRDLLEQLGEGDRFRLLAGDATAVPYRPEAVPATRENVDAALQFLAKRASLGWSDLDALLAAGLDGAPDGALVVYVGDGIPTTGDADPAAAASRIRRLGEDHAVSVHAVATSNTYEKPVLEAMAAIGGGSVRRADEGALGAARTLLEEAARPPVRDMTVEVEGIDAAAVYPEHLPNLPVGTQQVVLGRLRPSKESRRGTVVVRGRLGGEAVVYRAPIVLPAESGGNAFLPRLWARRHLDHLLAQGRTSEVQGEIVAFSRRYGIMTPYTSFLVLEDEADRERYGVERTVSMRDGEPFFLEAKDRAQLEARREAIRRTRLWRRGLRRRMVKEIAGLGRDRVPAASIRAVGWGWLEQASSADGLLTAGDGHGTLLGRDIRLTGNLAFGYADADRIFEEEKVVLTGRGGAYRGPGGGVPPVAKAHSDRVSRLAFHDVDLVPSNFTPPGQRASTDPTPPPPEPPEELAPEDLLPGKPLLLAGDGDNDDRGIQATSTFADTLAEEPPVGERASKKNAPALEEPWTPAGVGFPPLAPKPPAEEEPAVPDGPKEVLGALRSIDLARSLPRVGQPYRLVETVARVHPVRGPALEGAATTRVLVGPDRWHARSWQRGTSPTEAWLAGGERAVLDVGSGLGRRRPVVDGDRERLPVPLALFAWSDLPRRFERRPARLVERDGNVLHVAFEPRGLRDPTLHLRIDTERRALLEAWEERDGRTVMRQAFSDFVDVGGVAVPRREERFDRRGVADLRIFREVTPLSADALDRAVAAAVGAHEDAVWLGAVDPTVAEARRARDDGTAGFAAWLVLALDGATASDDERTFAAWTAARQALGERPGLDLIEAELLANARRGEALKALLTAVAAGPWHRRDAAACWLARRLDHRAAGFLGPEERRALLETDGMRGRWWTGGPPAEVSWLLTRRRLKETAGRADEGEPFPARLPYLPTLAYHVQGLALRGEVDEAVAALDAWRALPRLWSREDRSWLHEQKTDLLWTFRRTEALREATQAWTRDVPDDDEAWRRTWSVLPLLDRAAEADAEVLHVLRAPVPADPLSPGWARMVAAIRLALGDGWWTSASGVAEPFQAPLADLAGRLLRAGPPASDLAAQILANRRFWSTAAYDDLVRALREDLVTHGEDGTPSTLLAVLQALPWTSSSGLGPEEWSRIEDRVRERWEGLPTLAARTSVAEALLAAADARSDREGALSLLRRWREREHGEDRRVLAARLVDRLLARDWSGPAESEVVSLLGVVLPRERNDVRQEAAAVLARRLAAWVEKGRRERNVAREGVEKREATENARAEVADVLDLVAQEMGDPLAPFLEIERLGYAVEVGRDLVAVEGDAREALDAVPRGTDDAPALVRAGRAVLVLDYAATRRSAPERLPDRVLRMLAERDADPGDTRLDWRYERFRLLMALGRLDDAEGLLRTWTADAPPSNRWRPVLARLLAERGDMVEAAGVLEASRDQPAEVYALLATIDLALGKDDASEEATARRLDAMDVGDLQNALYAYEGPDLDPLGVRFAKALLAKAEFPTYHTWWVQRLYERTRDPRLLAAMAEAVPGHTTEAVYPLLTDIRDLEVRGEAALDDASRHARDLAAGATDASTARALWLLEAMWEARAAKTPDPDGDHTSRAVAALARAREVALVPGEARLLADYLVGWGALPLPALADARRTWLEEIAAAHAGPTAVDLDIHASYAAVLAAEGEKTRAADVLERAIARVRADGPGGLPPWADAVFHRWTGLLGDLGHFPAAEAAIRADGTRQRMLARRDERFVDLLRLYERALEDGGTTALGRGATLLEAVRPEVLRFLDEHSPAHAAGVVDAWIAMHRAAAKGSGVPDAGDRLERFAREDLAPRLLRFLPEATGMAKNVADALDTLSGPTVAIRYALDRMDVEPAFLERIDRDLWDDAHAALANWRHDAQRLEDPLRARLLARVLGALETALVEDAWRGQAFYRSSDKRFWAEEKDAFLAQAASVAERHPGSAAIQVRAADYVRDELKEAKLGADLLLAARHRGVESFTLVRALARWLVADGRFDEARPVAADFVAAWPGTLEAWELHAKALAGTGLPDEALERLREAERRWREHDAFDGDVALALGETALAVDRAEAAVAWLEEAASLWSAKDGHADWRLPRVWIPLAKARARLGRTEKAVEAAMAAVVAAGNSARRRKGALETLDLVLASAPDLAAWIRTWNERVDTEGRDAPLVRKALARVLEKSGERPRAIAQLELARALSPEDTEVYRHLVRLHDALGESEAAIETLRDEIAHAPRDLHAAEDLAVRLKTAGRAKEAERARTNLVEAQPHEAEGHRRLAAIRTKQGLTADAAAQWRQVVRTEPLDPTGWLALARAEASAGKAAAARRAIEHVLAGDWEARYGDVKKEAAALLAGAKEGR